jgi:hypothetical protein
MKNLEIVSGLIDNEAMAPCDMTTMPMEVDEEDAVSINSQPKSRKRSRSPADDNGPSSEFIVLDSPAIADILQAEKAQIDTIEEELYGDLFEEDPTADDCRVLSFEEKLLPVPKKVYPHYDDDGKIREMCHHKDISYLQPTLNANQGKGVRVLFKVL